MKTNTADGSAKQPNMAGFEALAMIHDTPHLRMKVGPEPVATKSHGPASKGTRTSRRRGLEVAIVMFLFTVAVCLLLAGYFRANSEVVRGRALGPNSEPHERSGK